MAETEKTAATLPDDLAALDLPQRREVAKALRKWPRRSIPRIWPRSPAPTTQGNG